MKIYNICGELKENLSNLYTTMYNKIFRDETGNILKNQNFIIFVNNNAMVAYINNVNVIHFKALQSKDEMILKQIKTAEEHVYKHELKNVKHDSFMNVKKEIDLSYNIQAMINNNYENINI